MADTAVFGRTTSMSNHPGGVERAPDGPVLDGTAGPRDQRALSTNPSSSDEALQALMEVLADIALEGPLSKTED